VPKSFSSSRPAATSEDRLPLQFQGNDRRNTREAQIAERTSTWKRHRAKAGLGSVFSMGFPRPPSNVKKPEVANAFYEVIDLGGHCGARRLSYFNGVKARYRRDRPLASSAEHRFPPRTVERRSGERDDRSVRCAIRAYKGTACFETSRGRREGKVNSRRASVAISPRCGAEKERPREDWIEILRPRDH